jgi:hypothetical protein
MGNRPHFLDEAPPPAGIRETAAPSAEPEAEHRAGLVLLEAGPDAPATLQASWRPQALTGPLAPAPGRAMGRARPCRRDHRLRRAVGHRVRFGYGQTLPLAGAGSWV